jgi:hypothetical protein
MTSDAAALLESDASKHDADRAEIAALKATIVDLRQNYISPKVYKMACEERDAAVAKLHNCPYQKKVTDCDRDTFYVCQKGKE